MLLQLASGEFCFCEIKLCVALEFVAYLFVVLCLQVFALFIFGAFCMFVCLYVGIHHFRLGNHTGVCLDTMGSQSAQISYY